MAKFWESLTEPGSENWALLWETFMGKKWVPPEKGRRPISCESELESLPEMQEIMEEAPNYTISVEGRK